jgi:two-component system sensor histidine kinase UhpB
MRQMVGERDERATRAAASAMSEQLSRRGAAIQSLATHAKHVNPAVALADMASFRIDFVGMALFGEDGSILAADDEEWWQQMLPLVQPAVRARQFRSDSLAATSDFLPVFVDPFTGQFRVIVLASEPGGAITAAGVFDPTDITRDALSQVVLPGDHTAAYLFSPAGDLIYQTGQAGHGSMLADHPGVTEALRGEIGTTYLPVDGDEHVVSYSPVAPTGWALVMEEPWREMTDPMLRWTELAPFVLLPVLAVALAGLWFGARQVVKPLQELAERTTALGQGDFTSVREPVGGIAEIRILQGELVNMARRIQMAQQGLRDYLGVLTIGQEEERLRLARELHDDTIQSLIALNQRVQLVQASVHDEQTAGQLVELERMAGETIAGLRQLTRDLRPSYLDDLGLAPALSYLARDQARVYDMPIELTVSGQEKRLAREVELAFYRIAQEALRNVARHAQATHVEMALDFGATTTMIIRDDGIGFVIAERVAEQALAGHFGLLGAQERAEAVNANFFIDSAPGAGTGVHVTYSE